jgi:hypothetical protein
LTDLRRSIILVSQTSAKRKRRDAVHVFVAISFASGGCLRAARRRPVLYPLEREIDGHCADDEEHPEGAPPGAIDGTEAHVLAWSQNEMVRPPEQRIVCAQLMRTGRDLRGDRIAMLEDSELVAIDRDEDFAEPDVVG